MENTKFKNYLAENRKTVISCLEDTHLPKSEWATAMKWMIENEGIFSGMLKSNIDNSPDLDFETQEAFAILEFTESGAEKAMTPEVRGRLMREFGDWNQEQIDMAKKYI